jgi:dTDP-4-amino-4,6-dideoxygalactose transaminase
MNEIRMCDLQTQYQRIKPEIDAAIQGVLNSTAFIKGPDVKLFEDELASYLGVKHVIGCANGTDALQVALMALGLKPGDEVITTDFTFIATVEVVGLLGLSPVIVDVDPDTFCIDIDKVKKAITPRTKAIVPVHVFGQNCDMIELKRIAEKHKIAIVEDCAQSLGSDYYWPCGTPKKSGTIGDIGCTSFFPSKNLGCFGDGGAVYTNNDELAEKLRYICNHGMKIRYYYETLGVNSRLDTIQAAILRVKLKHLDKYNKARIAAADYYDKALKDIVGLQTPVRAKNTNHIFHQYTLVVKNGKRDALKKHLESKGIPVMIYYPFPLHSQKAFEYLKLHDDDFKVTNQLCEKVLSLPMHTEFEEEQLQFITDTIIEFYK